MNTTKKRKSYFVGWGFWCKSLGLYIKWCIQGVEIAQAIEKMCF